MNTIVKSAATITATTILAPKVKSLSLTTVVVMLAVILAPRLVKADYQNRDFGQWHNGVNQTYENEQANKTRQLVNKMAKEESYRQAQEEQNEEAVLQQIEELESRINNLESRDLDQ